jgi:hypothetical protein
MSIAPYGRSFDEYCLMFGLSDRHASVRILGVGDGPSDFNAEATARGWRVVSVDPVYAYAEDELKRRCEEVIEPMVTAVSMVPSSWTWLRHQTVPALREHRVKTLHRFLNDIASAQTQRYVAAALPELPFRTAGFDVALCAHLLFVWSKQLDLEFHRRAIAEMLRVAAEVRMFPTGRNLAARRSPYADRVAEDALANGNQVRFQNLKEGSCDAGSECLIIARPS